MRMEEHIILRRKLFFEVPEGIELRFWSTWNNPENIEGRGLFLVRPTGVRCGVDTVNFFAKGGILWGISRNSLDCEIFVDGCTRHAEPHAFKVPDETIFKIGEDFPRFVLHIITPKRRRRELKGRQRNLEATVACRFFLPRLTKFILLQITS